IFTEKRDTYHHFLQVAKIVFHIGGSRNLMFLRGYRRCLFHFLELHHWHQYAPHCRLFVLKVLRSTSGRGIIK
ncbi:MAG: hypothetical protein Q4F69_12590, partial [Bacteroidia bacterium]|nr:hypothetical protein [Bacteroidia bacterium]